jgi:hypothetical protein
MLTKRTGKVAVHVADGLSRLGWMLARRGPGGQNHMQAGTICAHGATLCTIRPASPRAQHSDLPRCRHCLLAPYVGLGRACQPGRSRTDQRQLDGALALRGRRDPGTAPAYPPPRFPATAVNGRRKETTLELRSLGPSLIAHHLVAAASSHSRHLLSSDFSLPA